jgi:hypothetical protein
LPNDPGPEDGAAGPGALMGAGAAGALAFPAFSMRTYGKFALRRAGYSSARASSAITAVHAGSAA